MGPAHGCSTLYRSRGCCSAILHADLSLLLLLLLLLLLPSTRDALASKRPHQQVGGAACRTGALRA